MTQTHTLTLSELQSALVGHFEFLACPAWNPCQFSSFYRRFLHTVSPHFSLPNSLTSVARTKC